MQHICNNIPFVFKSDVKLFHQGFPPAGETFSDEWQINEVLMDYQYRARSVREKIENLRMERGNNPVGKLIK